MVTFANDYKKRKAAVTGNYTFTQDQLDQLKDKETQVTVPNQGKMQQRTLARVAKEANTQNKVQEAAADTKRTEMIAADPNVNPLKSTEIKVPEPEKKPETQEVQPQRRYADIVRDLYAGQLPTQEDIARQERRRKAQQSISAIGDAGAAIANLVGTLNGAKAVPYSPQNLLTERNRQKWEQARKEREAKQTAYYNQMLRAMQIDEQARRADNTNRSNLAYREAMAEKWKNDQENAAKKLAIQQFIAETDAEFKNANVDIKRQAMEIQRDLAAGRINLMKAQEDLARIRGAHVGDKSSGGGKKSTKDNTNYTALYAGMTDEEKAKYAKQVGVKLTTGSGTNSQERNLSDNDRKAIVKAKMGNSKPIVGRVNKKK
jgi:hypothetical protein